jgi:hypothetical protein
MVMDFRISFGFNWLGAFHTAPTGLGKREKAGGADEIHKRMKVSRLRRKRVGFGAAWDATESVKKGGQSKRVLDELAVKRLRGVLSRKGLLPKGIEDRRRRRPSKRR